MGYSRSDVENGKILAYWKKATYRCKCGNEITKKFLVPAPCWNCLKDVFKIDEVYKIKNCPKCSKENKPLPLPPPRCPHCKEKLISYFYPEEL